MPCKPVGTEDEWKREALISVILIADAVFSLETIMSSSEKTEMTNFLIASLSAKSKPKRVTFNVNINAEADYHNFINAIRQLGMNTDKKIQFNTKIHLGLRIGPSGPLPLSKDADRNERFEQVTSTLLRYKEPSQQHSNLLRIIKKKREKASKIFNN